MSKGRKSANMTELKITDILDRIEQIFNPARERVPERIAAALSSRIELRATISSRNSSLSTIYSAIALRPLKPVPRH